MSKKDRFVGEIEKRYELRKGEPFFFNAAGVEAVDVDRDNHLTGHVNGATVSRSSRSHPLDCAALFQAVAETLEQVVIGRPAGRITISDNSTERATGALIAEADSGAKVFHITCQRSSEHPFRDAIIHVS
jgi:small ligand-binding sensory domain FIST